VYSKQFGTQTAGGTSDGWATYFPFAGPVLFTNEGTPLVRVFSAMADIVNRPTIAIAQSVFFTVFPPESFTELFRVVVRQNVLRDFFVENEKHMGPNPNSPAEKVK
jgi:hypothetical protein